MTVHQCTDASPAQWLLDADRDWSDLAVRGPLGYQAYARLRFIPDPTYPGQHEGDAVVIDDRLLLSEVHRLAIVVSHLAKHTATPETGTAPSSVDSWG